MTEYRKLMNEFLATAEIFWKSDKNLNGPEWENYMKTLKAMCAYERKEL